MRRSGAAAAVILFLLAIGGSAQAPQPKGGGEETGAYDIVPGWPANYCGPGFAIGATGGIWAESPDRVIVFSRGCLPEIEDDRGPAENFIPLRNAANFDLSQTDPSRHPRWDHIVNIVDRNGRLVESWEQHNKLFVRPHRVVINPYDPERHVWLIDDGAHAIYKFTRDGKTLVMQLGEFKMPGNDDRHFARPTDIAWLPDGTFFISDGYTNTRVMKFDPNGKFLMQWGGPGTGNGQFNTVHAVDIDRNRRVYVSDRGNMRIQIFDENGKYLDQFGGLRQPQHVMVTADGSLGIIGGNNNKVVKYDLSGKMITSWGTQGTFPGAIWNPHQFSVDSDGNLYIAEATGGRTQKFRPKPGADRSRLIGPPQALMPLATN